MFYRSFFYECLVNIYFKKKEVLLSSQGKKYPFEDRPLDFVFIDTIFYLKNLCSNKALISFSLVKRIIERFYLRLLVSKFFKKSVYFHN